MGNGNDKENKKQWATQVPGGTKKPTGVVTLGDDKAVVVAKKPLGAIAWTGHRATIWAATDTSGKVVWQGGSKWEADLAALNRWGNGIVTAVSQMNAFETGWRQSVEEVRKATTQSATDIKKVEAELPAMREQRKKDDNLSRDVNLYLTAMENAEGIVGKIREAQEGVLKAASTLESSQAWEQANAKKEEIKDDEAKLKALEAEIAQYKHVFHEIADIAQKVAKQDWAGLAAKALDFAIDQAIDALADARYGKDLAEMQAKLAKAQAELKGLTFEALHKAVEAAHHGVNEALIRLDNARQEFNRSIGQVARLQTAASDRLNKSQSTKAVGLMLEKRAKQMYAITVASSKCESYLRDSATRRKTIGTGRDKYRVIGSWLDKAAAADPTFNRSKPYAKMIEQTALTNAVEFGNWDTYAQTVEAECKKALAWVADTGPSGPMVHFDRAVKVIKEGMVNPT